MTGPSYLLHKAIVTITGPSISRERIVEGESEVDDAGCRWRCMSGQEIGRVVEGNGWTERSRGFWDFGTRL